MTTTTIMITITAITTTMGTGTAMAEAVADAAGVYRLMTWLTASFPVGAFSYSHGLEWGVEDGTIRTVDALVAWVDDLLALGSGWNDAVLAAAAWRAAAAGDWPGLADVAELAAALTPTAERRLESLSQGRAFAAAIASAWPCEAVDRLRAMGGDLAYPVAVGAVAAGHGLSLSATLLGYLHGFVANLVSAALRLVPLGQTDGQRALARLEPLVLATAARAASSTLDDLGGAAWVADIASMNHETQYTRLFRS
ncbi:urease accessory protein UreF [Nitrospirillum sp. BR 11752]|uniref:urease accessory protein UreF n=1 Tax=Nitrospirillum sp. BR 11752 TaxID=3104293 RepID=UPI002EA37319|nr:urease accessory protein UreF [Nitrospirillum sp. BR 11752]